MKAALHLALAFLAATAGLSVTGVTRPVAVTPSDGLAEAVDGLTRAMVANDAAMVGRWLADDWIVIDGNGGIIDRARFLAVIDSGELVHDSMTFEAPDVRHFGTAVVWTARAHTSGRYRSAPFRFDERSSSLWARENEGWRCRFTQLTTIVGPDARSVD